MFEGIIWKGRANKEERCCYDCKFCIAYISWWCKNEECVEWRGSNLPGVKNCPFWEPCIEYETLSWWEKFKVRCRSTSLISVQER